MSHIETGYGYFPGGDPRTFAPDREMNTPEEIAAWERACEAWARGERPDTTSMRLVQGVRVCNSNGFGFGTYAIEIDDELPME